MNAGETFRIGVISDTHGLLRPEALAALAGVDHILHAGDVGRIEILDRLREISPVTAIRGNVDRMGPCALLPETEVALLSGQLFYLVHSRHDLDVDPKVAGVRVVVSGHSHRAEVSDEGGVMYLNPGSAGPLRFALPATLARVDVCGGGVSASLVTLGG